MISGLAERFDDRAVIEFDQAVGVSDPDCAYRICIAEEEAYKEITETYLEEPLYEVETPWSNFVAAINGFLGRTKGPAEPTPRTRKKRVRNVTFADKLAALAGDPRAGEVRALIVGNWGISYDGSSNAEVVDALVAERGNLTGLEALFIGDIPSEECELSWINQSNVGALWTAYPDLRAFHVRGGTELSLGTVSHANLRTLVVETGGLPPDVVTEVCEADLPQLDHLELWLGEENYGWKSKPEALLPILSGDLFPKLRYLGLRNFCESDALAQLLADAPILDHIEILDLSMGTLGDDGALALAKSTRGKKLTKLDVHHHFMTGKGIQALETLGVELEVSDVQQADAYGGETYRFVAAGE